MSSRKKDISIALINECLESKLLKGESKYEHKKNGTHTKYIFSSKTFEAYLNQSCQFIKWLRIENKALVYSLKTVDDIAKTKPYVDKYISYLIHAKPYSPWSQKLAVSALCKLYGCSSSDFIKTEIRERSKIKRSRKNVVVARDALFFKEKNELLINVTKNTGLRRAELEALKPIDVFLDGTEYYLRVGDAAKGGRHREVLILDKQLAEQILQMPKDKYVFLKNKPTNKTAINTKADIHSFRREYATNLYKKFARDINSIPKEDRYCCRKEQAGLWLDRKAMAIVSNNLGHNRISIFASSYADYQEIKGSDNNE